ncbi:hypothetical protein ACYJ1Y_00325 [Natrialbaceae archaeon A-gly3]
MNDGIRILNVDDDPGFADMTATFLERKNEAFDVQTATSADDGIYSRRGSERISTPYWQTLQKAA